MTTQQPGFSQVFTDMFRGIARPAVTIIFAVVLADTAWSGQTPPEWFMALAIPTITWWFAERTITHYQERKHQQEE